MLAEGFTRVRDAPLPVVWPALAIALTMVAFTLVGEAVRNIADPKGARLATARRVT
jgi:ABC-type dipeptide/oligopeptide/nickel transport system permease subunit